MQNSMLAKIALTVAVAVAGVGFLVRSSFDGAQHYKMVGELPPGSELAEWQGKELKVHGFVQDGTIVEKVVSQETHRTFVLQQSGKKIRVFNLGPKPDTFKDASEVVATGQLVPSETMKALAESLGVRIEADMPYVLDSTELMAKCPSKYDGATTNRKLDTNF